MIKKIFGITTLLFLSVFLIMPVYAAEPPAFQKTTDVFPGDLDYRNSLVDWNGYNIDILIYWSKAGGLPPSFIDLTAIKDGVNLFVANLWSIYGDPADSIYSLNLTNFQKQQIKGILFSRLYDEDTYIFLRSRTVTTDAFLLEIRIEFNSLLNVQFSSVYASDAFLQSAVGLINAFNKTIDLIGIEDSTGGPNDFVMQRITLDTHTTQAFGTGSVVWQNANYNFVDRYTNVKKLYYNVVISANSYDPATVEVRYYLRQLGFFASSQTILPDLNVDTDFQIYAPTTCGAIDIACVSRNLIGEFSNNIYKRFGADTIASGVMDIYDTIFYPVYMIDNSAWQNGVISIYGIVVLGVLYLLLKRNI